MVKDCGGHVISNVEVNGHVYSKTFFKEDYESQDEIMEEAREWTIEFSSYIPELNFSVPKILGTIVPGVTQIYKKPNNRDYEIPYISVNFFNGVKWCNTAFSVIKYGRKQAIKMAKEFRKLNHVKNV